MGDSDDEYDRKRRDKFRGERAEASYRSVERTARPRDDWVERDTWARPRPREYRMRDRGYSPSMEPAPKRVRHDYYPDGYYNNHFNYHQPQHRPGNFFREPAPSTPMEGQQPPMMSFKAFLATQDDNISDSEAIEKYNDYKLEFQRQQLNEFFVAHKDHEWFRLKYHPEDSLKRKEEQMTALKKRVEVYMELLHSGKIDGVSVDCSKTNDLLKLLDTIVIKLEGGNDEDIAYLDEEYAELDKKTEEPKVKEEISEKNNDSENNTKQEDGEIVTEPSESAEKPASQENGQNGEDEDGKEEGELDHEVKKDDEIVEIKEHDEAKEEDTQIDVDEPKEPENSKEEIDDNKEVKEEKQTKNKGEEEEEVVKEVEEVDEKEKSPEKKRKRSYSGSSSGSSSSSSDSEEEKEKEEPVKEEGEEEEEENVEKALETTPEEKETNDEPLDDIKPIKKPRFLHKTTSIFVRNLAPTITKQELQSICSRYDGFLRLALTDPQPERRWLRRGWVTFKRDANIKEICWNLNNIRLRDYELGAIVNKDLSRRIRPVNGITAHKQVVRSDIRISAKVVLNLDNKAGLWLDDEDNKEKPKQTFGLVSNNPILHNITDYLIEEASAEEEELLGLEPSSDVQDSTATVERDDDLISVLDRIILYLRVVHSVDYYNHCLYPNEDEMPTRCGVLHARGPPPSNKMELTQFIGASVEAKIAPYLPEKPKDENKNEVKLISLSLKDVSTEIDKFVQANTRELAKDKWLCPLSGKKFKGPDFVRKHIFNKHAEKLEEVKKEVEFFNNYLRDLKRPMLAEAPSPKREEPPAYTHHTNYGNSFGGGGYNRQPPFYNQGYNQRSRGFPMRGGRGNPGDIRPVIHYRDLDAPREPEEFI